MPNTFTTAVERAAYSVGPYEVRGKVWEQLDTGALFQATRQGAGLENWEQVSAARRGEINISLDEFRIVSSGGDVGAIAAIGGVLGSDTVPIGRGDAAETSEIHWAAASAIIVKYCKTLPADFSGASDVTVRLFVRTDNAGGGGIEAATFTVETGWDGGALVSDAATDATPAITLHSVDATVAAADIPDAPSVLTLMLTPGTHANDPIQLLGAKILYTRKVA